MNYYYDKCIVIGTGQFAFNCAEYLRDQYLLDGVYEYGSYTQSRLAALCVKNGFPYIRLSNKAECNRQMDNVINSGKRTLIVSASNIYLFPKHTTDNANIRIINYHPALLSRHLGRNVEAWTIYEQDRTAGVTWHEVTDEVDKGAVLAESSIELNDVITSVRLMLKQYQIGFELFKEMIGSIMADENMQIKMVESYGKMHYSSERPNDGILNPEWDADKISAFLRSMDYGNLQVMDVPFMIENGRQYTWDSYKILGADVGGWEHNDSNKILERQNVSFILENSHAVNDV